MSHLETSPQIMSIEIRFASVDGEDYFAPLGFRHLQAADPRLQGRRCNMKHMPCFASKRRTSLFLVYLELILSRVNLKLELHIIYMYAY